MRPVTALHISVDERARLLSKIDEYLRSLELSPDKSISLTISGRHGSLTGVEIRINEGW